MSIFVPFGPVARAQSPTGAQRVANSAARVICAAVVVGCLSGCGTINEKVSAGMGDYIPQIAGGLPANAPPRPGSARYDAYMKEMDRRRTLPPAEREAAEKANPSALGPAE